jgi:hypothetical protein
LANLRELFYFRLVIIIIIKNFLFSNISKGPQILHLLASGLTLLAAGRWFLTVGYWLLVTEKITTNDGQRTKDLYNGQQTTDN